MSLRNLKRYQQAVRQNKGILDTDQVQLETKSAPSDSDLAVGRIYCDGSTIYGYNGTSWVDMMTTGTINIAAWETLYAADTTLNITGGTLTFAGAHATNDVFTITNASGSGDCLQITNSGSGKDISGTANWSVTKAGVYDGTDATLDSITIGSGAAAGVIDSSGDYDLTLQTGNSSTSDITIIDGANGDVDITLDGTGAVNINGTTTANDALVVAAGDMSITDGSITVTDADNAAIMTLTTTGNSHGVVIVADAVAAGNVVDINADGLADGWGMHIDSNNGATFGTGGYFECYNGSATVFSITRYGATTIAGGAAAGTVFTVTAGDAVLSDGSLAITDADNVTSFTVTNDTITSADLVDINSGSLTTGSLVHLQADTAAPVTSGRILEMTADSATTATGLVELTADALTTGMGYLVTSTSAALTSGQLLNIDHTASSASLGNKTGQLIDIVSSRDYTKAADTCADDYDVLSVIRTNINTTAGGTMTADGAILYIENVATQTAGTLTDAVKGIEIVMDADGTGAGIDVITAQATTGVSINVTSSAATSTGSLTVTNDALTTGTALLLDSSGTITTTGDILSIIGNSATTSTGLLRISGTALTDGWVAQLTGGGATATSSGGVLDLVCGASTDGYGLRVVSTGDILAASTGMVNYTANALTTGDVLEISATAQTSGNLISLVGGGATLASGGSIIRADMGAATAGSGLEIVTTGAYIDTTDGILNVTANALTNGNAVIVNATAAITGTLLELNATGGTITTGNYLVCNDAALDVFAVKRNGHLASRQTTKPTIAVGTQNGITAAAITTGSTDTCGEITTTGTSATGDTIFTVTFEEAYAVAPRVFLMPTNEAAAQSADAATSGAYISATTTTTFVVTIPGASGATPQWDYLCVETAVA